jgi:multidrug efflux pump subunit AcrA (membrane-fusion protein)
MKILKPLLVLMLLAIAFGGGYLARGSASQDLAKGNGRRVLYYVDAMHPAYKSDKPGIAPDCGMALEPVYADGVAANAGRAERKVLFYRDPHVPSYTAHAPGVNPETGNTLEPVYESAAEAAPPGTVRIAPERQQLIGVKFATVTSEGGGRTIRTVGKVAIDETRIAHVHPRFEGWIEKVHVDFTGQVVRRGQTMVSVYSPEMLASQQELLLARKARDLMSGNPLQSAASHGDSLFAAARQRLELWGLTETQIDRVLETGQPIRSIALPAPASGYVMVRNAFPNQKVTPDSDLYTIADLSRVWVMADVYEADVTAIQVGQTATVQVPYAAGSAPLAARVMFIQPEVDPATRTIKVRLELPNPGTRLKPDMFVNTEFAVPGVERLTVPADAVLDAGDRQTVFVDRGNGYLEPRQVQVGQRLGNRIAISRGLNAGERVVASGTFLVDSESQLRSAIDTLSRTEPAAAVPPKPAQHAKANHD